MDQFKDLIQQKFGQQKVYQQAQEGLVLAEANKLLAKLWPQWQTGLQAVYLKNKIVTIAVLYDEALPDLQQRKSQLIQEVNDKFSAPVIIDWQFLT